jgi:hypothetical protein
MALASSELVYRDDGERVHDTVVRADGYVFANHEALLAQPKAGFVVAGRCIGIVEPPVAARPVNDPTSCVLLARTDTDDVTEREAL